VGQALSLANFADKDWRLQRTIGLRPANGDEDAL
jgi:hypothetical protein